MNEQSVLSSSNNPPFISVLVAAYNAEKTIIRAIDSVICQTYPNWEVIVADDGSTDKTFLVTKERYVSDERIAIVGLDHQGVSCARNKLIKMASGNFVIFLDADDVLEHDALENLLNTASSEKSDIVLGRALRIKNGLEYELPQFVDAGLISLSGKRFSEYPSLVYSLGAANKLIATSLAKSFEFEPNLTSGEDQPWVVSCYLQARSISTSKAITYRWIFEEKSDKSSLSTQVSKGELSALISLIDAMEISLKCILDAKLNGTVPHELCQRYLERSFRVDFVPAFNQMQKRGIQISIEFLDAWSRLTSLNKHDPDLFSSVANELSEVFIFGMRSQMKSPKPYRKFWGSFMQSTMQILDCRFVSVGYGMSASKALTRILNIDNRQVVKGAKKVIGLRNFKTYIRAVQIVVLIQLIVKFPSKFLSKSPSASM